MKRMAPLLLPVIVVVLAYLGCSSETVSSGAGDAAPPEDGAASSDGDGRSDALADARGATDAGDGGGGGACSFNSDCIASERCECDEQTGCFCKPGVRGTGKAGVDTCADGNDCESALCVEGPGDGGVFYCSGECTSPSQCGPHLPVCATIASVGRVCIRSPDGGA